MSAKAKREKIITAALIVTFIFAGLGVLHHFKRFNFFEYKTYDLRVKLFADSYKPSDDIMVILLDQHSIDWANQEKGWGWPWPRKAYADIVDFMNQGGASSVAFDVLFTEPSIYRSADQDIIIDTAVQRMEELREGITGLPLGGPSGGQRPPPTENQRQILSNYFAAMAALQSLSDRVDDNTFIKAGEDYGRMVQAVFFSTQTGSADTWPSDINKPLFNLNGFDPIISNYSLTEERLRAQFPIPALANAAGVLGNVTNAKDSDDINRRARLFINFDGKAVPGLSAASLLVSGHSGDIYYNEKKRQIEWDEYVIPVDKEGKSILRFRGSLNRYIPYSAADILKSAEAVAKGHEPIYYPEEFEGKYIFFGFYAPGLFDICANPLESVYPGMGVHITMLDNILNGDFIRDTTQGTDLILLFITVLLTTALTLFVDKLRISLGGTILIALAIIGGALIAYDLFCLWIPLVLPMAGFTVSFLTCYIYNYATEGSQKRFIKSAFSQYLSPKVIEQIIADPSQLKLGGEKREMTALFTDIRAFSTFSEALGDPAKLVELLNFYLTRMSNIVLENQGTIDKYMGDAIIAFFGAPVYMKNNASLACRSAILMKKAEIEMNREVLENGLITPKVLDALAAKGKLGVSADGGPSPLFTRLGVNTGSMVVGNMGTPNKMDYTIMGNAVNLASRLEGVNDQYSTSGIIISEYTKDLISEEEFVFRPLSRVRVVGINTPLRLYELLDLQESATTELSEINKYWASVFKVYENKDFAKALEGFKAVCNKNNKDLVARLYMNRCEKYLKTPPSAEEWDDGVDNLTSK